MFGDLITSAMLHPDAEEARLFVFTSTDHATCCTKLLYQWFFFSPTKCVSGDASKVPHKQFEHFS